MALTLELEGGFDPLVVVWTKQSGGYREDFLVGTSAGASDVVWWGLTLPLWTDYHFTISHTITSSTFYFVMNRANESQPIGEPRMEYYADVLDASLSGDLAHGGMVVSSDAKSLTVTYKCLFEGISPFSLSVPVSGYETIVWKWTKRCGSIRTDFAVGTRPFYDDAVSKGISTWAYSSLLHSAFVFPDKESSTFYFSQLNLAASASSHAHNLNDSETDLNASPEASTPISIAFVGVKTTLNSCTPFLLGNATEGSATIVPGADSVLQLDIWYNCTRPGSTNVTVTVVFEGPYAPVTFTWNKRVGKGRNALIIGTHPFWDDAVSRGIPTPLYNPATYSAFYAPSKLHADFYAQMTHEYSTQVVKSVSVSSSSLWCLPRIKTVWETTTKSIAEQEAETKSIEGGSDGGKIDHSKAPLGLPSNLPPSLVPIYEDTVRNAANWTGPSTIDGGLLKNAPQHFRVYFDCIVGGASEMNVTFDLQDWGPLTISMKAYSGGARPYLDIGTSRGASDVVQGGLPTPLWNSPPLNGAIVSGNVLWTAFWLGMSTNVTQLLSPPYLTYQTQDPIISPYSTGNFASGGAVDQSFNSVLNVTYNCTGLGRVPMSIGFILPPYDTITFTWTKVCSAQRIGLMVGSNAGDHSVVQNGLPSMAWNPETHVAFVLPAITQSTFWVGLEGKKANLSPNAPAPLTPPAISSEETQLISSVIVNSSLPICRPYIEGKLTAGTILQEGSFLPFLVVYNCSDIGETDIQVTLMLTGNFIPISFMWTKRSGGAFSGLSVGRSAPTGTPSASTASISSDATTISARGATSASALTFSSDVIYYGAATYAYDPLSHTHASTSLPQRFYVGVTAIPVPMPSLRALPASAMSFSPWLLPSVGGPMSAARMMTNESWSDFTIDAHCLLGTHAQKFKPTVYGFVTMVPFSPAIFAYSVSCPPNLPGLSVGFDTSHNDVVTNGVPHGSWSPANTSRIEIEADYNILRFWISAASDIDLASILIAEDGIIIAEPIADGTMQNGDEEETIQINENLDPEYLSAMDKMHRSMASFKSQMADKENQRQSSTNLSENKEERDDFVKLDFSSSLTSTASRNSKRSGSRKRSSQSSFAYPVFPTPACTAALSGDVWNMMEVTLEPRLLQLELNCSIGGTNNVSVILVPKNTSYSSTVWTFSKTMGGFRHGFDVAVSPAFVSNATFTESTPALVMEDGEAYSAWAPISSSPSTPGAPSGPEPLSTPPPTSISPISSSSPSFGPSVVSPLAFVPSARQQPNSAATSFVIELSNVYFGRDPLQEYASPSINVSSPGCSPILLGNASSSGYLQKNVPKVIDVVNNCYNATDGRLTVFEISIGIPPFQPAVWAWSRASTGLPSYLNVDVQLDSKTRRWEPLLVNGESVTAPAWTGSTFALRYYLSTSQFENLGSMYGRTGDTTPKQLLAATGLYFDVTPVVNVTVPNCNFAVSGNMTDDDEPRNLDLFGAPLVMRVDATACNASAVDFLVSFTAQPFTTPMSVKISRVPPAPQKSKVSGALLGIIIGSTVLIIGAISVGLYLCLRRPPVAPSTGAYHLRRRKQEREQQVSLLDDNLDAIN